MEQNTYRLYTVKQLSEILGLHLQTIRGYIKKGKLKAFRLGKGYRVAKEDLEEFLGKRRVT